MGQPIIQAIGARARNLFRRSAACHCVHIMWFGIGKFAWESQARFLPRLMTHRFTESYLAPYAWRIPTTMSASMKSQTTDNLLILSGGRDN